jgi:hypothetical protein
LAHWAGDEAHGCTDVQRLRFGAENDGDHLRIAGQPPDRGC